MKLFEYNHNNIRSNEIIKNSLSCLKNMPLKGIESRATPIRKYITSEMSSIGWSNRTIIHPETQISITGILNDTALCVQLGNVSRYYADLLKLQFLYQSKKCSQSIYILPTYSFAKLLGSNISNFDRLTKELKIFKKIITIPILVLGFEIEEK